TNSFYSDNNIIIRRNSFSDIRNSNNIFCIGVIYDIHFACASILSSQHNLLKNSNEYKIEKQNKHNITNVINHTLNNIIQTNDTSKSIPVYNYQNNNSNTNTILFNTDKTHLKEKSLENYLTGSKSRSNTLEYDSKNNIFNIISATKI
ncbi:hypothetical protein PFDG_05306, partial [Plasmodium falciparum Dd2]